MVNSNGKHVMSKLSLIIFVLVLIFLNPILLKSQCGNSVTLNTQTQINDLLTVTYPGCTHFMGNIIISDDNNGFDDITDLSPLSDLSIIDGNLEIINNSSLTNINGLSSLTSINNNLEILDNNQLDYLHGLKFLTYVGGNLKIENNDILGYNSINDFCGIYTLLNASLPQGLNGTYIVENNATNPTQVEILDNGSCPCGYSGLYVPLASQDAVNNFIDNYCENFIGFISIYDSSDGTYDITDLTPLSTLKNVYGNLHILFNNFLIDLNGLSSLKSVSGDLYIFSNPNLTNIDALTNLKTSGYLRVQANYNLSNINGLSSLQSVNEDVFIFDNDYLLNLNGLSSLESVRGDLTILYNSTLGSNGVTDYCGLYTLLDPANSQGLDGTYNTNYNASNPTQTDIINNGSCPCGSGITVTLSSQKEVNDFMIHYCQKFSGNLIIQDDNDGFDNITALSPLSDLLQIGGNLEIRYNNNLTNIEGLSSLISIGQNLVFYENPVLTNINGLSSLNTIGGYLSFNTNNVLLNTNGLSSLSFLGGGLAFYNNLALNDIDFFLLNSINGDLNFINNPSLVNLDGLSSLTSVNNYLYFYGNSSLNDITGLSQLESVGGNLTFSNNNALLNLNGLESLESVGASVYLNDNSSLIQIDALSALQTIGDNLYIGENPLLENIDGLTNLESVGKYLYIQNNPALTNIDGLSTLTTVNSDVKLDNNAELININGLSSLSNIGGSFLINNNPVMINLEGLNSLLSVYGNLVITNNISLDSLSDYCSLNRLLIMSGGLGGNYNVSGNTYNATMQDILYSITCCIPFNCFADNDGDGYGDANSIASFCLSCGPGYVQNNTDCNDNDISIYDFSSAKYSYEDFCFSNLSAAISATGGNGTIRVHASINPLEINTIPSGVVIVIENGVTWTNSVMLKNNGNIILDNGSSFINIKGGIYKGSGVFNGNFQNAGGTISPGN